MDQEPEVTPADINQEIYDLFDDYVHNRIDRRSFLYSVSKYTITGLTATAVLDYLSPRYALAKQVAEDDPRIKTKVIEYKSSKGAGTMRGILTMPANAKGKLPGILVVHENRGLNPYIEDVTRRAALAGYVALGPDALTPLGGYPGTDDEGRELQGKRDRNEILEDFIAGYQYLNGHEKTTGKIGVVGFCFGGWISNMMAARVSGLDAAVPFYGGQAPVEEVPNINAPLLLQFAENDERVNKGWSDYEAALKKHKKDYQEFTYPGTQHGFHNDTTPRYSPEAAKLAWERTIAFFDKHLKR